MKIALLEPLNISDKLLDEMARPLLDRGHELTVYDTKPESPLEIVLRSQGCEAVILANTPFPESALAALPQLRYIDVAFTGVDHICMDYCHQHDILVSNSANYSNESVAELTLGLIIGLLRKIPECDAATRGHKTSAGIMGREISGRTVGIVGLGRIGMRVAKILLAFGARVVAYDPVPQEEAKILGVQYETLEEVLSSADIITLHAPANSTTRKIMNRETFALMKDGALFVNCARGALVDSAALADALKSGKLAGAAVDVFDKEPPLDDSEPLLSAPNLILTPHVAFASEESMIRRARIVFRNLIAWMDGCPENLM